MSAVSSDLGMDSAEYKRDIARYGWGFGLSVVLTLASLVIVAGGLFPGVAWGTVGLLGIAQLVIQFWAFMHLDFSMESRRDLYLVMFSFLIVIILAGGTVWVLADLASRMGMGDMSKMSTPMVTDMGTPATQAPATGMKEMSGSN
ncbi:cytochrome C oxidase subunit IV family protein [uncultured Thioclava sp.]|uniref:Cytochrome bo(3) ubiquinol oxidase subunit 4 n=1 Tax=Thioclava arctica TaxID=3238301 RepID=A0ABV3TG77_9RHOB|nr:cytochrome C oxidase subunit IV family protein [uncultured Thioclava sp.]